MTQEMLDKANRIYESRKTVDKLLNIVKENHHIQIGSEDGRIVRLDELDYSTRDRIIAMLTTNLHEIRNDLNDKFNKL